MKQEKLIKFQLNPNNYKKLFHFSKAKNQNLNLIKLLN